MNENHRVGTSLTFLWKLGMLTNSSYSERTSTQEQNAIGNKQLPINKFFVNIV